MNSTATETVPLLATLTARATEALQHWGLSQQVPVLLKFRENAVFRILLANGQPAALRLHRPGYHGVDALASELDWMAALRQADMHVPSPIATPDGRYLVALAATAELSSQHADIVSWMEGTPLGRSGMALPHSREALASIFSALGEAMARLHGASDGWTPPAGFHRPAWDREGLLGENPLWGRFWDCAGLSVDQAATLCGVRQMLLRRMDTLPALDLDYGLIHADLVRENVLLDGATIGMIDFDDGGPGWRMFDIATALFKNRLEPDYPAIKSALISGYRKLRPLSEAALSTLPLFMVLRAATYVGWIGERPDIPDAEARLQRYVADTLVLAPELTA